MSDLSSITKEHFPGLRFRGTDLQHAGRLLKKHSPSAVVEYLTGKGSTTLADFRPPAKCNIIAQSRPFDQWPIYKASMAIQTYVYGLTKDERAVCAPGTSSAAQKAWLASTGIDTAGYTSVQGLNLIIAHTLACYDGVVVKVGNANKKTRAKVERINKSRAENGEDLLPLPSEAQAFGDDGKLSLPPGINHNIYLYQQSSPVPLSEKHVDIAVPHVPRLTATTELPLYGNRLDIPKGSPGYVPEWQRSGLSTNKHKRMRMWYSTTNRKPKFGRRTVGVPECVREAGAIPLVSRIGDDWVVFDGRGLLRNLRWRGLVEKSLTIETMLSFFTGDPVIDVKRGVAAFIYKQAHATVKSRKVLVGAKRAHAMLMESAKPVDGKVVQVGLVSVDLGQTNPVAFEVSRVHQTNSTLQADPIARDLLPNELVHKIDWYRAALDVANAIIRKSAIASLSSEQKAEIVAVDSGAATTTKSAVVALIGRDAPLPWEKMSSSTTYISEALYAAGKALTAAPNGKMFSDNYWARHLRPKLTPETRTALNDAMWDLMRESSEYRRLSVRKLELARRCVNHVLATARKLTKCADIMVVVEDLNVRMFHGSGKRDVGWDEFFTPKRENRWFMQVLHKAFTDLAQHRGIMVAEVNPARTSITCPACGHCDKANRDAKDRERFCCIGCGRVFNADLEVATANIRQIAITGANMPKPVEADCERLRGSSKPRTARKSRKVPK